MIVKLDSLDPKFRQITDLLLFSDKMDINLSDFSLHLKSNYSANLEYFLDRFIKSCDIFWENGNNLWFYRLNFILSVQDKNISKKVSDFLEKRMFNLTRRKSLIDPNYDVEYLQYLNFCKVKNKNQENLDFAKNFLEELPSHYKIINIIKIIESFTPIVYKDVDEYASAISRKINKSTKNFFMLKALEKAGIKYNKNWLIDLTISLISEKCSDKNRRLFFALISDDDVLNGVKEKYSSYYKSKLISLLNSCDYSLLENNHLSNIKNLIKLDKTIAENISTIYINKLYSRKYTHKKSNADRLLRLTKEVPEISVRMVLSYLASKHKMNDVKYMIDNFPEVQNLSAFL